MAEQEQPAASSTTSTSTKAVELASEVGVVYRSKVFGNGKGKMALTCLTSVDRLACMSDNDMLSMEVEVTDGPCYKPVKAIKPNKLLIDALGNHCFKLKLMVSLPRVYNWISYEHLYSDIDKALFSGDNEFQSAMKKFVPELCGENLTRMEWNKVRSVIECAKPRRFSSKFLSDAREELYHRRNEIRKVQQGKEFENSEWMHKTLPYIPAQYEIGTIVTARLFKPKNGVRLFEGRVMEAVNTVNNTYKVYLFVLDVVRDILDISLKATGPMEIISKEVLPGIKELKKAEEVASELGIPETPLAPNQTVSVGVGDTEKSVELRCSSLCRVI